MNQDFDNEVMWAVSGTGDDFQCVHVDFAREQRAEIERLRAELKETQKKLDKIAKHPNTPELIRQYAAGMLDDRTAGPLNSAPS